MTLPGWLRGRNPQEAPSQPRHIEIWGQLAENNRFLRRLTGAALAWSFAALAMGSFGLVTGLYRPLAYQVDETGRAAFVGRLREHLGPADVEVRYVAKEFLKRYIALNSLTIESDWAEAWNLMTEELRQEQQRVLAQYEKEHGEEFVAYVKKQGIQTLLDFDAKRLEVRDHNGKTFTVKAHGIARSWPLSRAGEDAAFTEKSFDSVLTLVRCPRTEGTPNGLLVHKVVNRFFVDEKKEDPR
jgi:hypothetical protein